MKLPDPICHSRDCTPPPERSVNFVLWLRHEGPCVKSADGEVDIKMLLFVVEVHPASDVAVSTTLKFPEVVKE